MGMELAKMVFEKTEHFPSAEKYGLISQINRSVVSIPSNISGGSSSTNKSFIHFLDISLGSSFELQTQILLASYRGILTEEETEQLEFKIEEFQKATMTFQNTLN